VGNLAATPSSMSRNASPVSGILHSEEAASAAKIDAALRAVLSATPAPIRRREVLARVTAMGLKVESTDPVRLVGTRLSMAKFAVSLKGHGYWHRDRPYAPAGWVGRQEKCRQDVAPVYRSVRLSPDFAKVSPFMEFESAEARTKHRLRDETRLRSAWAAGGSTDVMDLLEASLRFIMRYAEEPMSMADCQAELVALDIPAPIRNRLKYRVAKSYEWMDRIHKAGFWMKGRPAPADTASPDGMIRDAMRDVLLESEAPLSAEVIVARIKEQGIVISLSGVDEMPIARKHLHQVERIRSKTSVGFWIPKRVRCA